MMGIRTCRACGCWELRACKGGRSWISADRCSACPDAPFVLPINPAHIAASSFEEVAHYQWSSGEDTIHRYMHRSIDYPTIVVLSTTRGPVEISRTVYLGAMEIPADDWSTAAQILNEAATRKAA